MELSSKLIKDFVAATNDTPPIDESKETYFYGTVVDAGADGEALVRLDGSTVSTPVENTMAIKEGDRVMVLLKNHRAIVTGNATAPATDDTKVDGVLDDLAEGTGKYIKKLDGSLLIDGSVKADAIDIENVFAQDINATGTITGVNLEGNVVSCNDQFYMRDSGVFGYDPSLPIYARNYCIFGFGWGDDVNALYFGRMSYNPRFPGEYTPMGGSIEVVSHANFLDGAWINTASDRRLKDDLGEMPDDEAAALLNAKVHNYRYKNDDPDLVRSGLMAQDLRDILKNDGIGYRAYLGQRVNGTNSTFSHDLNASEEDVMYSIEYSQLVPILWKGWQMHEKKIHELEERIAKLERGE